VLDGQASKGNVWLARLVLAMAAVVVATAGAVAWLWLGGSAPAQSSDYVLACVAGADSAANNLYLMDEHGRELAEVGDAEAYYLPLAWSPDGERLVTGRLGGRDAGLYLVEWEDGEPREQQLMAALGFLPAGAAWSPDGRRLAVLGSPTQGGAGASSVLAMCEMPDLSCQAKPLPVQSFEMGGVLSWTPDGSALIFSGMVMPEDPATSLVLFAPLRYEVATGALQRMALNGLSATVSAQGLIAYVTVPPEAPGIWTMSAGGTPPNLLGELDTQGSWSSNLSWSPDGNLLASLTDDDGSSTLGIWSPREGLLAEYPAPYEERHASYLLAWSPDGRFVSYTLYAGESGTTLVIVDVSTGATDMWPLEPGLLRGHALWRPGEH
jgi:Tol biopolymer transport system component